MGKVTPGEAGMSLTLMASKPRHQGLSKIVIKAQESERASQSGTPVKL